MARSVLKSAATAVLANPMFWLPQFGKMAAELTHDEKAQISHRAKALKVLLSKLKLTQ